MNFLELSTTARLKQAIAVQRDPAASIRRLFDCSRRAGVGQPLFGREESVHIVRRFAQIGDGERSKKRKSNKFKLNSTYGLWCGRLGSIGSIRSTGEDACTTTG